MRSIFIPSDKKVSADTLTSWAAVVDDAEARAAAMAADAKAQRERWRAAAERSGLAKLARELEHPSPPTPVRHSEHDTRVRALTSFSTSYEDRPVYMGPRDVRLMPRKLAMILAKAGHVEIVDDTVALGAAPPR